MLPTDDMPAARGSDDGEIGPGEGGAGRGKPRRAAPSASGMRGGDEGIRTPDLLIANPRAHLDNATQDGPTDHSTDGLSRACHEAAYPGGLDLPSALRALADVGLPPEALAAAVEALLRAAKAVPAPVAGPRRIETA